MGLSDLLSGGLGVIGNLFNANQARHAADQFHNEGDPERSLLRQYTLDPSSYFNGPIGQGLADQADRRYSATFGNPAGSGTAQALSLQAMLNGYGSERDRLFQEGGGNAMNNAYPGAVTNSQNANLGIFGSLLDMLGILGSGGGGGGGAGAAGGLAGAGDIPDTAALA